MLPFLIASIERLVAVQMVGIGALFVGKQLNARLGGIEPSLKSPAAGGRTENIGNQHGQPSRRL